MSQIVLHKSGCDPDFKANRRFHIDVAPLIDSLVGKNRCILKMILYGTILKLVFCVCRKRIEDGRGKKSGRSQK